jgi:hypothetical protein
MSILWPELDAKSVLLRDQLECGSCLHWQWRCELCCHSSESRVMAAGIGVGAEPVVELT